MNGNEEVSDAKIFLLDSVKCLDGPLITPKASPFKSKCWRTKILCELDWIVENK